MIAARLTRLRRDEDGAALALALAFLTLFGLLIGSLLGFTETGIRSSEAYNGQGDHLAAASGAIDGAINRLRDDIDAGVEGYDETCFAPPDINGVNAAARCTGEPGSGAVTGSQALDIPDEAVIALASGSEDGVVQSVAGVTATIGGPLASRTTVSATGTLAVNGAVRALGDCTGTVTTTDPPLSCANTGGGAGSIDDPGYEAELGALPADRSVPACGAGWLVTFQPGTYRDAAAMNALMDGTCANKVFWFSPGTYYFPLDATGSGAAWVVDDQTAIVVGGTPLGWSTSAPSKPAVTVPGACDQDDTGVQFVFGRAGRLHVRAGAMEVCAPPHTDRQRIALYGLTDNVSGPSTSTTLVPAAASSGTFAPATEARVINGTVASAAMPGTNPGSVVTATLSSFGGIPAGSTITAATLRVAHRESPSGQVASVTATVQPASGPSLAVDVPRRATLGTNAIDLLAEGLSATADLSSVTVTYRVEASKNRSPTVSLDGIELDLTYAAEGLSAQSGCVTATPYPSSGCPFLEVTGGQTTVHIQGTVYAPTAAVRIAPTGSSIARLRRGLVARTLRIDAPASWAQSAAVVGIPANPNPPTVADRRVVLLGRVDGVDRIRALVTFGDGNGATPGATVSVDTWVVL